MIQQEVEGKGDGKDTTRHVKWTYRGHFKKQPRFTKALHELGKPKHTYCVRICPLFHFGLLDTWMTPHKQYGGMLCSRSLWLQLGGALSLCETQEPLCGSENVTRVSINIVLNSKFLGEIFLKMK